MNKEDEHYASYITEPSALNFFALKVSFFFSKCFIENKKPHSINLKWLQNV